jgi:hypothetical protein
MFQRGAHQFKTVLDVFQGLARLFLDPAHDFAFSGPLLIGSSTGTVFERIPSRRSGKEKNVDVSFGSKPRRPVHLFFMVMRPERAPVIFDFFLCLALERLFVCGHVSSPPCDR